MRTDLDPIKYLSDDRIGFIDDKQKTQNIGVDLGQLIDIFYN
jgi:hypothetical protein